MKRSIKSFAKKASNLSGSVHQQLSMFAVAAVVAALSVLALAQPSESKIVYTPANVVFSCESVPAMHHPPGFCGRQYNLDLNHDGVTDFTIDVQTVPGMDCIGWGSVSELPADGDGVMGTPAAVLNQWCTDRSRPTIMVAAATYIENLTIFSLALARPRPVSERIETEPFGNF